MTLHRHTPSEPLNEVFKILAENALKGRVPAAVRGHQKIAKM